MTTSSTSSTFYSANTYSDETLLSIQAQPVSDDLFQVPADIQFKPCKGSYAFMTGCWKMFKENQKVMQKMGIKLEEQKTQFKTNEEFDE